MRSWYPNDGGRIIAPQPPPAELGEDDEGSTEHPSDPFFEPAAGWRFDERAGLMLGPEHPTRKGWYATREKGKKGEALWYKPPGFIHRWVHRIAWAIIWAAVVLMVWLKLSGLA